MKRLGVYVDVSNLYYCVEKAHKKKIDYAKYLNYLSDVGVIKTQVAYAAVMGNEANAFIHAMEKLSFLVKQKTPKEYPSSTGLKRKCDFDVQMAVDILDAHTQFDMLVLGSADGDLTPVVSWLSIRGISTLVLASGISRELKDAAKLAIEIPPSFLC